MQLSEGLGPIKFQDGPGGLQRAFQERLLSVVLGWPWTAARVISSRGAMRWGSAQLQHWLAPPHPLRDGASLDVSLCLHNGIAEGVLFGCPRKLGAHSENTLPNAVGLLGVILLRLLGFLQQD